MMESRLSGIGAVILAAGEAKRAGGPKAVWEAGGRPAVRRVAEAALGAREVAGTLVVTGGPWADEVRRALGGLDVKIVPNPDYALGQSASLKAGLRALDPDISTAIFLLADQPFLTSQIIDDLLNFQMEQKAGIAAPTRGGRRLNPVAFDLKRFRVALMSLEGDRGGRDLILEHQGELALWPAEHIDAKCFADFDTAEEYERLILAGENERY